MRFIIVERYADNGELSHRALIDTTDGREVGTDGGEPEDASFWRDWAWVPDELNKHDAALRRAKAEGRQEQQALLDEAYQVMSLWFKYFNSDIRPIDEWTEVAGRVNAWLPLARDARAAQIEEGEHDDSHTSND